VSAFGTTVQRHWLLVVNLLLGIWLLLPFAAPAMMALGAAAPARAIYAAYSLQCHQLPQRSYFLFGGKLTYSLDEINTARGDYSLDVLRLRQFIGDDRLGYKVAWSDRMVSLYGSIFLGGLLYALARRRIRPLQFARLAVLLLPLAVDGLTHTVSDLWGIGQGFRDSNAWLRALTAGAFPPAFYAGDVWGSFNSLMRLITGVLAGLAIAWTIYPRLDAVLRAD
jgi:uncharacterized membrane protein